MAKTKQLLPGQYKAEFTARHGYLVRRIVDQLRSAIDAAREERDDAE